MTIRKKAFSRKFGLELGSIDEQLSNLQEKQQQAGELAFQSQNLENIVRGLDFNDSIVPLFVKGQLIEAYAATSIAASESIKAVSGAKHIYESARVSRNILKRFSPAAELIAETVGGNSTEAGLYFSDLFYDSRREPNFIKIERPEKIRQEDYFLPIIIKQDQ